MGNLQSHDAWRINVVYRVMPLFMKFFCPALSAAALVVAACAQEGVTPQSISFQPSISITPPTETAPPAPSPTKFNSIKTTRPVLALTFDDGPHPELTPKLLDILRQKGVRATFFVLGSNVAKYPDIARRIVAEGHEIANHSYNHPALTKLGASRMNDEVGGTCEIIEKVTGRRPASMRPPYGALNSTVEHALLQNYGLNIVLWSVDPYDWKRPGATEVTRRLVEGARPGAILLAHDIHPGTIEAIPEVITQLKNRGYTFATVGQLQALQNASPHSGEIAKVGGTRHGSHGAEEGQIKPRPISIP